MRPIHRARTGCLTCRVRKIKCDEQKPVCRHCNRATRACAWPPLDAPRLPQHRPRRANDTACVACREKKKLKCVGELNTICTRCVRLGLACQRQLLLHEEPRPASSNSSTISPAGTTPGAPTGALSELPDDDELEGLLTLYFSSVNSFGFYTFVHRPHLDHLRSQGKAPRNLLLMMIASATRFAAPATPENLARADAWADAAIQATLPRIYEGFGAVQLMVLLLAQHYDLHRGRFTSAWLLGGNCTRMMQLMSLHTLDRNESDPVKERAEPSARQGAHTLLPLLTPEALRRVAWSAFCADTINDAGRYSYHTVDDAFFSRLQLPCDNRRFLADEAVVTPPLLANLRPDVKQTQDVLDVSAYLVRTFAVRRRTLHVAYRIAHGLASIEQLAAELDAAEADIAQVRASLPQNLAWTTENIKRHQYEDLLLFEPRRLTDVAPWPDTESPSIVDVLPHLLAVLRQIAERSDFVKQLHVEAVHRLLRFDYLHLLEKRDLDAFSSEYRVVGQGTAEYDFQDFHRARLERLQRGVRPPTDDRSSNSVLVVANDKLLLEYNVDAPHDVPENLTSDPATGTQAAPQAQDTPMSGLPPMPDLSVLPTLSTGLVPQPQTWWSTAGDSNQTTHDNDPFALDLTWLMDESGYTGHEMGDPTVFWNQLDLI
ncbi:hypothetical protein SEUCBS140593_009511 [Sporothrix eucalyptigena]|uniref:Zn(2)-C6 fungal-type domain-containing protein n=1 Tax=Sporothrix eucalyptigena TaxID=1812306 RepID=A0ABP0CVF1_9PEZI